MEEQRINIFSEFIAAFYDFKSYKNFVKNSGGKVFLYTLFLILISLLLSLILPAVIANYELDENGIKGYLEKNVPDFYLQNSEFYIEEPYSFADSGLYANINSDIYSDKALNVVDIISNNDAVLIMDAEKAIIKSKGQVQTFFYSESGEDLNFTKNDLISFVPLIYAAFVVFVIFGYIFKILGFLTVSLIIAAAAKFIIAALAKAPVYFGEAFNLTVYSRTMPLILASLLQFFEIRIPYMWLICAVISFVYLYFALKNIAESKNFLNSDLNSHNGSL